MRERERVGFQREKDSRIRLINRSFFIRRFSSQRRIFPCKFYTGKMLTVKFYICYLCRRKMIIVNACPLGLSAEESIDHLLLSCVMAQKIWNSILSSYKCSWVFQKHISNLFDGCRFGIGPPKEKIMWASCFLCNNMAYMEGKKSKVS